MEGKFSLSLCCDWNRRPECAARELGSLFTETVMRGIRKDSFCWSDLCVLDVRKEISRASKLPNGRVLGPKTWLLGVGPPANEPTIEAPFSGSQKLSRNAVAEAGKCAAKWPSSDLNRGLQLETILFSR